MPLEDQLDVGVIAQRDRHQADTLCAWGRAASASARMRSVSKARTGR